MKIEKFIISNWRSIKELEVEFEDMMVFIGQNNHGKSNILSSILFFFGEIKHQDLDFKAHRSKVDPIVNTKIGII
ncbi:MAG: DUF2813 domain-containing protein [Candidatus Electrothrix sp. AR3]|nr:DUF2813 domain-containing protein [Candidatus Electrothrix sp. AR3]